MTGSSPSDLAAAFRSFGRRYREALAPASDDPHSAEAGRAAALAARFEALIDRVAVEMHAPRLDTVADTALGIAEAIEQIPADRWAAGHLERLQEEALAAGMLLRDIERLFPSD